jgi:virginiamycin B lyase
VTIARLFLNTILIVGLLMNWDHISFAASNLATSPKELRIQAKIDRSGYGLAEGFGSIWMMSNGRLARINVEDNTVIDIDIPSEGGGSLADIDKYRGIEVGEGAVWVPDMGSSTIYKIDPIQNSVSLKIPTDMFASQGSIGVGEGSVWVVTFDTRNKTLTRYDAQSGAIEAKIPLPRPGKGVLVAYGSVWVTSANDPELYRIDPKTDRLVSTTAISDSTHILARGHQSVWLAFEKNGVVQRVDPQEGKVIGTIETSAKDMESDGDITAGRSFIWFITRSSTLAQIDPQSNSLKGIFRAKSGTVIGRRLVYAAGSVWVSGSSVFRLELP